MYKRQNYKRGFKSEKETKTFIQEHPRTDSGIPEKPYSDDNSLTLNDRSLRDLKWGMSIATKVDPQAEATTASQPYAIIASRNHAIDANYPGESNIGGNVLVRLNNNQRSGLLYQYDSAHLSMALNYLYLGIHSQEWDDTSKTWIPIDKNWAMNLQVSQTATEALSKGYAEMLTQLPFFINRIYSPSFVVQPDWYSYDSSQNPGGVKPDNGWLGSRLPMLIWYQSVLQNLASIPAKFNSTMSIRQALIDMGYNNEAPFTTELFNLLSKAVFKGQVNAISNFITGEFFDFDWFTQVNTLTMVPSRETTSMTSPLMTITATHSIPKDIVMTTMSSTSTGTTETVVFDSETYTDNQDKYLPTYNSETGRWAWGPAENVSIQRICHDILTWLDPQHILYWARCRHYGWSSSQYEDGLPFEKMTTQFYFDTIVRWLSVLNAKMSRFNLEMGDLRTALDRMNSLNLNYWKRGIFFDVMRTPLADPVYNVLVANVFQTQGFSCDNLIYDYETARWKYWSLWDKYTGIPMYDRFEGGAFLTFSSRSLPDEETDDNNVYLNNKWLLPILFSIDSSDITLLSRKAYITQVDHKIISASDLDSNNFLARLNPLNSSEIEVRLPYVDTTDWTFAEADKGHEAQLRSSLYMVMQTIFNGGLITVPSETGSDNDYAISNTILTFIDIELNDISNSMISYARAYGPFRVVVSQGDRTVGFLRGLRKGL